MDFSEKCRLCLKAGLVTSIYHVRNSISIAARIMSFVDIDILPGDGLPSTICNKCLKKLDSFIDFVEMCKVSDTKLRSLLQDKEEWNTSLGTDEELYLDDGFHINGTDNVTDLSIQEKTNNTHNSLLEKSSDNEDKDVLDEKKVKIRNISKQQCFTCGKIMSSRFRLKTHLRIHTGERPFSCAHCGKNFSQAENLKVHLRIHTGEKPLKCSVCDATFAHSAGLAAHERKHTGLTPYQCTLCPRSFRTVGHLQYHLRRHTGEKNFECDTCGRAFITRSDLKQHLLTHTGEKRHICCLCGLRLSRASHLKRHIDHTHNGVKPFACTLCPSKFTQKGDYEKHKKRHENKERDETA